METIRRITLNCMFRRLPDSPHRELRQVKMVMALTATLTGVYTTDVNLNNVISQTIAGVNAPAAPVPTVANPTLNNPSVSAPAVTTTGTAVPGVSAVSDLLQ